MHFTKPLDLSTIFSFWNTLTKTQSDFLQGSAKIETFENGKLIHRSDGDCKGIMAVLSGSLRVYCVSDEGREVTLYRVESGDICILSASCLMDSIVFDVLIEAAGDTKVCLLPSAAIHKVETENQLIELYIYKNATEKFSEVLWTLQQLLFMKIDQRLARFLHDEMLRQKSQVLSITHEDIAKQIGSAREVVTKTLKYLSEEGVVLVTRGKIELLDRAKLSELM